MPNHWSDDGDLVIEDRTLFRKVGYQAHPLWRLLQGTPDQRAGARGHSPVYVQIATDHGDGWED